MGMTKDILYNKLAKICGSKNVSNDTKELEKYSEDMSFVSGKRPNLIVWPSKAHHVEAILKLANSSNFSVIPVSSSSIYRHHGDTIPKKNNSIILNLSKMSRILSISRKNRVVMVEPGVTFEVLIPKLKKKGVRLLIPLHPTSNKSVLSSALEREPITIPRYHWDSSDPLLCTEVIFGTGDLFRTGTAAGPGTLKQQKRSGQNQINPMGPTQFSPFRVIQGAQGSIGVVTWATVKLELLPSIQKVFHLQSQNLQELLDFQFELLKNRLCDELLILNNLNLACLIKSTEQDIYELSNSLKKWNLIFIITGRGMLANEKISYLEGDINEIKNKLDLSNLTSENNVDDQEIIRVLSEPALKPWKMKLKGSYQEIFFLTSFERISEFISLVETKISKNLGIYIQPINQGTSYHCEFDLFYDPQDGMGVKRLKELFIDTSKDLINLGAFFNRPYGDWAEDVYKSLDDSIIMALKKVKKIFDPNNVLNPGVLCFD